MDAVNSKYRGAQGLDPKFIEQLEKQFGFDKPAHERFLLMLWNYLRFDFGKSYFRDTSVIELVRQKLPVSMSLGLWMLLISYLVRRAPNILGTFARFGLTPTGYRPGYQTVQEVERNAIEFFSNVPMPLPHNAPPPLDAALAGQGPD